jgi:hypothetical protein
MPIRGISENSECSFSLSNNDHSHQLVGLQAKRLIRKARTTGRWELRHCRNHSRNRSRSRSIVQSDIRYDFEHIWMADKSWFPFHSDPEWASMRPEKGHPNSPNEVQYRNQSECDRRCASDPPLETCEARQKGMPKESQTANVQYFT